MDAVLWNQEALVVQIHFHLGMNTNFVDAFEGKSRKAFVSSRAGVRRS